MLKQGNQVMTEILGLREAMHKDNETTQRQLTDMRSENRKMRAENVQVHDLAHSVDASSEMLALTRKQLALVTAERDTLGCSCQDSRRACGL